MFTGTISAFKIASDRLLFGSHFSKLKPCVKHFKEVKYFNVVRFLGF